MAFIDSILDQLALLIRQGRFEELETDALEIKAVPADRGQWHEAHKSINAFLNTRGGVVLLGIKEEGQGKARKYVVTGWREQAEAKLKEIPKLFSDDQGQHLDLGESFPPIQLKELLGKRIALVFVDELSADRKFVFYNGTAYERKLTGDHEISTNRLQAQKEFRREAIHARELQLVKGTLLKDIDLDKLNQYIQHLNRPIKIETIKTSLKAAQPFLERKSFKVNDNITTLGMLVCGKHPADYLEFRCQVHGYVDIPDKIAQDKQDLVDNVLPLMEASLAYILRNIKVGISPAEGGSYAPEYPDTLLRETVNNALAHRDYAINKQCIIAIKPGQHLAIRNPGEFPKHLLVEDTKGVMTLRRIIPEAKPRNPKLADVLRVFRKWEGRGIGMATLVNLCLENKIDLPYYRFHTEEVCLFLRPGKLLDERMERYLQSFDQFLETSLQGNPLTPAQKMVLAYLIKSEWANDEIAYSILLTPDNNHFQELLNLEKAGLIAKSEAGSSIYPVYMVNPVLMRRDFYPQLRTVFGPSFDKLNPLAKELLAVVYRFNRYAKTKYVSAKQASFFLWYLDPSRPNDIKAFDSFYRRVRSTFNALEGKKLVEKKRHKGTIGYGLTQVQDEPMPLFGQE